MSLIIIFILFFECTFNKQKQTNVYILKYYLSGKESPLFLNENGQKENHLIITVVLFIYLFFFCWRKYTNYEKKKKTF